MERHSFGAISLFIIGFLVARFISGPIGASMIGVSCVFYLIFILRNWRIMGEGAGRMNIIILICALMVFLWSLGNGV